MRKHSEDVKDCDEERAELALREQERAIQFIYGRPSLFTEYLKKQAWQDIIRRNVESAEAQKIMRDNQYGKK